MNQEILQQLKVLIVDDEILNVKLLEQLLRKVGYTNLQSTTDSRQVLSLHHEFQPDLILLDLMMPHLDGFAVMEQIRQTMLSNDFLPILVLTADASLDTKRRALAAGATDFLTKPFDQVEVRLRIDNLLRTRWQHTELQQQNHLLDEKVRERTHDLETAQREVVSNLTKLEQAQGEVLSRLAQAAEFRDDDTGQHTYRVGEMAALIATRLGLPEDEVDLIRRTAPLHDVGKIGIPDEILLKPGKLSPEEFDQMKTHAAIGAALLRDGDSTLMRMAETIALTHHERWNGTGYPRRLQKEEIPIAGRIVAVADVFDALTNERPYKKAWPISEAVAEIERQSGQQFDPSVVQAFATLPHEDLSTSNTVAG
jgi:putative two-component system response regulator